jgi:hypothetical protein
LKLRLAIPYKKIVNDPAQRDKMFPRKNAVLDYFALAVSIHGLERSKYRNIII